MSDWKDEVIQKLVARQDKLLDLLTKAIEQAHAWQLRAMDLEEECKELRATLSEKVADD